MTYTSDYFDKMFELLKGLLSEGKAYLDNTPVEQMRQERIKKIESACRNQTPEKNLEIFELMLQGKAEDYCVRAKINMQDNNGCLRDPVMARASNVPHHKTGTKYKVYPTYDFAHGQEDAIEGVTHSLCSLEFADHRPLYNWFLENLPVDELGFEVKPTQYEFARLNPDYTVTSKRKLKQLVDEGVVEGWDDPRMPTVAGYRRRGYTPRAIRNFCEMIGVTKANSTHDIAMLEYSIRDDLDKNAPRAMCVLNPLKVILTNYPEDKTEVMQAPGHPNRDDLGERELPFGKEVFIDADDFREEANKLEI